MPILRDSSNTLERKSERKGRDFGQEFGCEYIADYKDLLSRDNIDVVSICTPSGSHADQAIYRSAELGKPVELPLTAD